MEEYSGTLGLRGIIEKAIKGSKIVMPERITDDFLARLIHEGLAFTASTDPFEAVQQIREAQGRVVILPLEHRILKEESDRLIKGVNPENYLYIDSAPAVRRALELSRAFAEMAGKKWGLPGNLTIDKVVRMTDEIAKMSGMYPYFMIKAAFEVRKPEEPPIGFYWVGNDGRPRIITWMRAIRGHERYKDYKDGKLRLEMDDMVYGQAMKFTVPSSSTKDSYPIWLNFIPIFSKDDREQHFYWRRLSSTDSVPDAGYRGLAHKKREIEPIFFTVNAICCYDIVAVRLREKHELGVGLEVQINPFPQLTRHGKDLLRLLREQTIVGRRGLNVTEMDNSFGADTKNNGYDYNFANWTR